MYKFYKGAFVFYPTKSKRERHMQLVEEQKLWKRDYAHDNTVRWHRNWRKLEWARQDSLAIIYSFEIADVDM